MMNNTHIAGDCAESSPNYLHKEEHRNNHRQLDDKLKDPVLSLEYYKKIYLELSKDLEKNLNYVDGLMEKSQNGGEKINKMIQRYYNLEDEVLKLKHETKALKEVFRTFDDAKAYKEKSFLTSNCMDTVLQEKF